MVIVVDVHGRTVDVGFQRVVFEWQVGQFKLTEAEKKCTRQEEKNSFKSFHVFDL